VIDPHRPAVVAARRRLIGLCARLQGKALQLLESNDLDGARALASRWFGRTDGTIDELLDRPIRVVGVVANDGEPGGGPFWVQGDEGITPQIVEGAQRAQGDPEQDAIWGRSTHFNPVDMVCGLRDAQGDAYDLGHFVDDKTWMLASKSHRGVALTALERPGLWNGSMARWNTVFVELPRETFHPAKTVVDLLRGGHVP
jgi:hypothetical protein